MARKTRQFTAVYKRTGKWYSAWIEEIPGVNTQGKTLREAKENLKEALRLVLETAHTMTESGGARNTVREPLAISI
jgi:predicted RNase H-like HicB family nuclease